MPPAAFPESKFVGVLAPDVLKAERRFLADELALVPRFACAGTVSRLFHGDAPVVA